MGIEKIVYAGHSAVFLHSKDFVIAIDPWLDGNPLCPPSLRNPAQLDLIILTHGHSDHASDAVRLAKSCGAHIAATFELAMLLTNEGVPQAQVIPMNKGGSITYQKIRISLTHAFHSSSYDTANGPVYAGEACGVVLNDGNRSFYHAGDTALFSDMQLIEELYAPEIALLPIGDRFTMGPREAQQALAMIRPKRVIPIHYKTFSALTGTAEEFKERCGESPETCDIEVVALRPGEELIIG